MKLKLIVKKLDIKFKDILQLDIKELKNRGIFKGGKFQQKKKPAKEPKNIKLVSLDMGSQVTKIVVGEKKKNKLYIDKLIKINTPEGTISDGILINKLLLPNEIKKALANNGISVKDVVCTNNSTSIINREIIVPKVEDYEMGTLLKYEIQQYLPINMDDYTVQSSVMEEFEMGEVTKNKLLVVTYPNRMSKSYLDMFSENGFRPCALDIHNNSIKKLYNNCEDINSSLKNRESAVVFIDLGAESLDVTVVNKGILEFMRIIKSGGSFIDRKIANMLSVSIKEAEEQKKENANLFQANNDINDIIRNVVNEWVDELGRIIQFYTNKKVENRIDKIYIYGGSSKIKGLDEYMQNKLSIRVEKITTLDNIEFNKNTSNVNIEDYLNAIGALIRL